MELGGIHPSYSFPLCFTSLAYIYIFSLEIFFLDVSLYMIQLSCDSLSWDMIFWWHGAAVLPSDAIFILLCTQNQHGNFPVFFFFFLHLGNKDGVMSWLGPTSSCLLLLLTQRTLLFCFLLPTFLLTKTFCLLNKCEVFCYYAQYFQQ